MSPNAFFRTLLKKSAIKKYSLQIQDDPDYTLFAQRGALYCEVGNYEKALSDYFSADEYSKKTNIITDGYRQSIGLIFWLMGKKNEAVKTWADIIDNFNKVSYSDFSGGIENGAILWYASCFGEFQNLRSKAEEFLQSRMKLKRAENWPGPIAPYLLDLISSNELIKLSHCESKILESRQLCQAYFYIGIKEHFDKDLKMYVDIMKKSFEFGKVTRLENEYNLANYELKRIKNLKN